MSYFLGRYRRAWFESRLFLLERGIDVARLPSPFAVIEGKTC